VSGQSAKWQKIIIIVFWVLLIASFWIITRAQDLSLTELLQLLINFAKDNPLGMGALFLAFLLRPILLLPSTVLAVGTGYLYGPWFKVNLPAFLLASVIGGAPGGIMSVLAGASIEGDFDAGSINIRFSYLIAASLIFLGSLVLSRLIRRKRDKAETGVSH